MNLEKLKLEFEADRVKVNIITINIASAQSDQHEFTSRCSFPLFQDTDLENAFGQRLSEPPGDINADQFVVSAKTLTFEERVKVHSREKSCASCHKKLDPIAFALNDYDTIGRMTGEPNHEAKRQLTARLHGVSRTMARSFTRNLIAYSVGRDLSLIHI